MLSRERDQSWKMLRAKHYCLVLYLFFFFLLVAWLALCVKRSPLTKNVTLVRYPAKACGQSCALVLSYATRVFLRGLGFSSNSHRKKIKHFRSLWLCSVVIWVDGAGCQGRPCMPGARPHCSRVPRNSTYQLRVRMLATQITIIINIIIITFSTTRKKLLSDPHQRQGRYLPSIFV